MILSTGQRDGYFWIESDCDLGDLIEHCSEVIAGSYIAITSVDSGTFTPSEEDIRKGWLNVEGLAYSPLLTSASDLPADSWCRDCRGFDEWYVFDTKPEPLGRLCSDNPFTTEIAPGRVFAFINYLSLRLSNADDEIAELLWRQIRWIQPESWVGEGRIALFFVTRRQSLFDTVRDKLAYIA